MKKKELNIMLVNLSDVIPKEEVHMLKVLYEDLANVKAKLQKAECAFDLFEILRITNTLNPTDISVLFETIELTGLTYLKEIIEKFQPFPNEVNITQFSAYRQRVVSLGKGFSVKDLRKLNQQYRVDFSNSWELIQHLESNHILTQHNMPSFLQSLKEIGIKEGIREASPSKRPNLHKGSREALTSKGPELDKDNREASTSKRPMLNEGIGVASTSKRPKLHKEASTSKQPMLIEERYSMTNMPRGKCLIINNMTFMGIRKMKERTGSEIDEVNLKILFSSLGFEVNIERNATLQVMNRLLEDVSQVDHKNYDCFVCCILSHGGLGTIFSSDEVPCNILDITSLFRPQYCPSLAGKPKLFFLQACQGSRKAEAFEHLQVDTAEPSTENIPDDADFLLGYSTAPGNVSFRSTVKGSWYISKLTEALKKYHNTSHILDILTHVNSEVSEAIARESKGTYKQVPAPQFTLRKQLFLTKS